MTQISAALLSKPHHRQKAPSLYRQAVSIERGKKRARENTSKQQRSS